MNSPSNQQSDQAASSPQQRSDPVEPERPRLAPVVREEQRPAPVESKKQQPLRKLRIYSHSSLFYWWPVWAVGYVLVLLTYWQGLEHQIGQTTTRIYPSSIPGLVFFLVLFLVILITNVVLRGLASAMVVMGLGIVTLVAAYLGWWAGIFGWFGDLEIYLNLGAYFWFSNLMFVLWAVCVFGLDRLSYWEVKPGQLTHETLFGSGSKSYNTQGMGLDKHRDDVFRHWVLGLGSGDLQIHTSGATRELIDVPNVLFISSKVDAMQRLIAETPDGSRDS
jgi:hypothetical protein